MAVSEEHWLESKGKKKYGESHDIAWEMWNGRDIKASLIYISHTEL